MKKSRTRTQNNISSITIVMVAAIIALSMTIRHVEILNKAQEQVNKRMFQLYEELDVLQIHFVDDENSDKAFLLSNENEYRYATDDEFDKFKKVFNSLNLSEEQKNDFIPGFTISSEGVERCLLCQKLGIRDYRVEDNNVTIYLHDGEIRDANLDEFIQIKEFESLH